MSRVADRVRTPRHTKPPTFTLYSFQDLVFVWTVRYCTPVAAVSSVSYSLKLAHNEQPSIGSLTCVELEYNPFQRQKESCTQQCDGSSTQPFLCFFVVCCSSSQQQFREKKLLAGKLGKFMFFFLFFFYKIGPSLLCRCVLRHLQPATSWGHELSRCVS